MGDILHALPAVTALRQAHPCWIIDWVVEPRWQGLLSAPGATLRGDAQPVVDHLHFASTKAWRKNPLSRATLADLRALRSALRAGCYDTVLDLQGAIRSSVVASLTGSRRRIGEATPRETPARWLTTEHVATCGAHVIEQDVELAEAIAADELAPVRPELPICPAAEAWCNQILSCSGTPAVLINPGAGWGAKRWPSERYGAVAQALARKGYRVLINVGPGEEPLAAPILEATNGKATPVAATLDQLIALTRRVRLVLAGDTGPLHLACALGKPVVGIYGPTDPSRNGPFGVPFRVLRSPESKRDHRRLADPEAGLLTIEPDAVLAAAEELLQQGSS
jgi:heptosyltransferase-1